MIFNFIFPYKSLLFWSIITTTIILNIIPLNSFAQIPKNQQITGTTGGNNNSGDCGYIGSQPNHVINLNEQVYSLNIVVETNQGKPSLLVLGPGESDRFCILGESSAGKYPKMGGVWAAGKYLIYVGDAQGNKNPFTMKITTK
ncbi:hypothetical protein [Geminocystis sp. NIES-3709]|uniref:hypothetical protein n=1 Tax=Geminocystis sp. NIES-3709 TaxID=1617448 RepID=UPI0005FCDC42|nr:hypothetical protein [Geminocystis sp. NIES-3709]BAQ65856.1 hypothetical protein GM3709_2621 [Geminocystis sp. NIES-3709]